MPTPEQQAREAIDRMLVEAGWAVQSMGELNLGVSVGVAVREFPLASGAADCLLSANRRPRGAS